MYNNNGVLTVTLHDLLTVIGRVKKIKDLELMWSLWNGMEESKEVKWRHERLQRWGGLYWVGRHDVIGIAFSFLSVTDRICVVNVVNVTGDICCVPCGLFFIVEEA